MDDRMSGAIVRLMRHQMTAKRQIVSIVQRLGNATLNSAEYKLGMNSKLEKFW